VHVVDGVGLPPLREYIREQLLVLLAVESDGPIDDATLGTLDGPAWLGAIWAVEWAQAATPNDHTT
jgi:hypothetical protein